MVLVLRWYWKNFVPEVDEHASVEEAAQQAVYEADYALSNLECIEVIADSGERQLLDLDAARATVPPRPDRPRLPAVAFVELTSPRGDRAVESYTEQGRAEREYERLVGVLGSDRVSIRTVASR